MKILESVLVPAGTPIITLRFMNLMLGIHRRLTRKLAYSHRIGCQLQLSKTNEMGLFIEFWNLNIEHDEPYRPIGMSTKHHSIASIEAKEKAIIDFLNGEREFPQPIEFEGL